MTCSMRCVGVDGAIVVFLLLSNEAYCWLHDRGGRVVWLFAHHGGAIRCRAYGSCSQTSSTGMEPQVRHVGACLTTHATSLTRLGQLPQLLDTLRARYRGCDRSIPTLLCR